MRKFLIIILGLFLISPSLVSATDFGFTVTLDTAYQQPNLINFKRTVDKLVENNQSYIRVALFEWDIDGQNSTAQTITWNQTNLQVYEQALQYARQKNLKIVLVTNVPTYAKNYSDSDYQNVAHMYYQYLSTRFGSMVDIWQVFNEANTHNFKDYSNISSYDSAYLSQLNNLISIARTEIKTVNPSALITTNVAGLPLSDADIDNTWIRFYSGIIGNIDLLSPDIYPGNFVDGINYMPHVLTRLKDQFQKPISVAETGHCTESTWGSQAIYLPQLINKLKTVNLHSIIVYQYQDQSITSTDPCERSFGIEDINGIPKEGYVPVMQAMQGPDIPEPQIGVPTKLFGGTLPTELGNGNGNVYAPYIMIENGVYKMWYGGQGDDGHDRIHYAESSDGLYWIKRGVVLDRGNSNHVNDPSVLKIGTTYYMYYTDSPTTELDEIHLATSNDGISWQKRNPVIAVSGSWDKYAGRPSVIYDEGIFKMWYDGRTNSLPGTESKIGYATSTDGFSWTRYDDNPIFTDDAYDEGQGLSKVAAVNVKKIENQYVMIYQAKGTKWASSTDGIHWQKRGILIQLSGTDFDRLYHATPKIFIDEHMKATAIYMAGVSVPEWNQNSIGIVKLKGDEFVQILSGDLNNDNKVDIFDYNLIVADFGKSGTPGFTPADITKDGKIDIFDYNILVGNFGKSNV